MIGNFWALPRASKARAGEAARRYLQGRGLEPGAWTRFRLGFAPDSSNALMNHLIAKGVALADMVEAGLVRPSEDNRPARDFFYDRVMFPIADPRGRIVAFGGRGLSPDAKPKYINTGETTLFSKGRMLYNFGPAREAALSSYRVGFLAAIDRALELGVIHRHAAVARGGDLQPFVDQPVDGLLAQGLVIGHGRLVALRLAGQLSHALLHLDLGHQLVVDHGHDVVGRGGGGGGLGRDGLGQRGGMRKGQGRAQGQHTEDGSGGCDHGVSEVDCTPVLSSRSSW